jgi:hypothetical protein
MHFVGFIIRMYHDARSSERQIVSFMFSTRRAREEISLKTIVCCAIIVFSVEDNKCI